jgi:mono/diheme cytochrome c family protein
MILVLLVGPDLAAEPLGKWADLATLVGGSVAIVSVAVEDPIYKKTKRYSGHRLSALLRNAWPNVERWASEGAMLIFHCADGCSPSMRLSLALSDGAIIATRDLDRSAEDPWEPFSHGKQMITPAPFYLVWAGISATDTAHKWPYQLISVSVEAPDIRYANATPGEEASDAVRRGFALFVENCAACHSVNLAGGELAPELNIPRNITEYWSTDHLAAFIKAPESYRARSKMPGFPHLTDTERGAILSYLAVMRNRKICADGKC